MRRCGVVLAAVAGLLLTACSGDDPEAASTTTPEGTTSETSEATETEASETDATSSETAGETAGATGSEAVAAGPVAAVMPGLGTPFFDAMADGIEDEAGAEGVEVELQGSSSPQDQADRLSTLAGRDVACYVVNPLSESNLIAPLVQIARQEVPVVNIDLPISRQAAQGVDVEIATYIGTDDVAAGRIGGKFMSETLGGEGSVALVGGIGADPTSLRRLDGFREGLADGIEVISTVSGDGVRETAMAQAERILDDAPDLGGFFATNDVMALGVAEAVANAGLTGEVAVLGVDGIEDALEAVESGMLTGTVSEYPYAMGQLGVDACLAAVAGQELPENVDAPVQLVTAENVEQTREHLSEPLTPYDNPFEQ